MKRLVLRITTHGAPFNIVGNGPVVMVFANLDREARIVIVGGLDKTVRTSPASLASPDTTARATTVARMVVAVTRWRIPLVPRGTDELPSPTNTRSLQIFYFSQSLQSKTTCRGRVSNGGHLWTVSLRVKLRDIDVDQRVPRHRICRE